MMTLHSGTPRWMTKAGRTLVLVALVVGLTASSGAAATIEVMSWVYTNSLGMQTSQQTLVDANKDSVVSASQRLTNVNAVSYSHISVEASAAVGRLGVSVWGEAFCSADCANWDDPVWTSYHEGIDGGALLRVTERVQIDGATEGFIRQRSRLHGDDLSVSGLFMDDYEHGAYVTFAALWRPDGATADQQLFRHDVDTGVWGTSPGMQWRFGSGGEGETIDGRWEGGEGETIDGRGMVEVPVVASATLTYYLLAYANCRALPYGPAVDQVESRSCSARLDFSNTALIGQFEVINPDGTINANARIISESGFDYAGRIAGDFSWLDGEANPVPEPATLVLLSSGLGLVLGHRRRIRRRATQS